LVADSARDALLVRDALADMNKHRVRLARRSLNDTRPSPTSTRVAVQRANLTDRLLEQEQRRQRYRLEDMEFENRLRRQDYDYDDDARKHCSGRRC
jgi:hypothetical protein